MVDKRKIAIATASRAERALLQPIYDKLAEMDEAVCWWFPVMSGEGTLYRTARIRTQLSTRHPDAILVPADRVEMVPVAMVAYYMKIPIFHLYAGVGYTGTYDDLNRRIISSYAYMLLAEDEKARDRLIRAGEEVWRVKVVGSTHADTLIIDESLAPLEPFDLVLINGNPGDLNDELLTLKTTRELINPWKRTLWIEPSESYTSGAMEQFKRALPGFHRMVFMPTVERSLFLGLMNKCERFITNSSALVYEWPLIHANGKLVNVGKRNAERATEATKLPPAAEKVADLIAHYTLAPEKLLKPYGKHRRTLADGPPVFSQP